MGESKQWWVFFRLLGLQILDERPELEVPCFLDATVISRDSIDETIKCLKFGERGVPGNDDEAGTISMVKRLIRDEEFHSFLAIRRTGLMNPEGSPSRDPILQGATTRATELSAVLSIGLLAHSRNAATCALAERLQLSFVSVTAIAPTEGGFVQTIRTTGSGAYIARGKTVTAVTRAELKAIFNHEELASLVDIVVLRGKRVPSSIRQAVTQACVRLSESLHSTSVASRVLGAVTTLEMLVLSEANTDYSTIKLRLTALVGVPEVERLGLDEILNARHRYVHRGEEPDDPSLSDRAIALGILTLIRFSALALKFEARESVVKYLDFVGRTSAIVSHLPSDKSALLEGIRMHTTTPSRLSFVSAPEAREAEGV